MPMRIEFLRMRYCIHKCVNSPTQTSIKSVNQAIAINETKLMNKSTILIILK